MIVSNSGRHSPGLDYRTKDVADPEAWLVLRAQSGDRDALETLLEGVQRPLHRYVLRLIVTGHQPMTCSRKR